MKSLIILIILVVAFTGAAAGVLYMNSKEKTVNSPVASSPNVAQQSNLPKIGLAPEFSGITQWLNSDNQSLTIAKLRGSVVLVNFWTFDCINCIHTLPYVAKWYDTYKGKGLVVVGIHTPEFEYEHYTNNVKKAIAQYNIHYPVAQDNNYETWTAYKNQYWPSYYLVDKKGIIRRSYAGEGEYKETEAAIQQLLDE